MRICWSAIFSGAKRVKRALFALCRRIIRSRTEARFSSKTPANRQPAKAAELSDREQLPISEDLQAPLENLITVIQHEATKSLTGQALSDVLAASQRMSDRLRLGIKNEGQGYGLIPLTQGKFAIVDAEDYDTCPEQSRRIRFRISYYQITPYITR